jgi:DNA end-binding protein Ku
MASKRSPQGPRPVWSGFLRLSLVSIPVKAYSARDKKQSTIDLDWLHRDCNQRIRYQKTCPVHGEISKDEIVNGFEFRKGQYVVIEDAEIERFRRKREDMISVDVVIRPEDVDCMYFTDKTYYLLPNGNVAKKPYAIIAHALKDQERYGVAQMVLFKREHLVLLRPMAGVLTLTTLNFQDEFRDVHSFASQLQRPSISKREHEIAATLIDALTTDEFDFSSYHDEYVNEMKDLIDAKVKGKKIAPQKKEPEPPAALSFIEALKKSLAQTKKQAKPRRRKKVS